MRYNLPVLLPCLPVLFASAFEWFASSYFITTSIGLVGSLVPGYSNEKNLASLLPSKTFHLAIYYRTHDLHDTPNKYHLEKAYGISIPVVYT